MKKKYGKEIPIMIVCIYDDVSAFFYNSFINYLCFIKFKTMPNSYNCVK